jgi:AraC-like DNA-binding protein
VEKAVLNPVVFKHLLAELAARGISPSVLCRGLGFDPQAFDAHEFRISEHQATRMLDRALRFGPAWPLGHRVGLRRTLVSSGLLGLALSSARSLCEGLTLIAHHRQAMGSMLDIHVEPKRNGALDVVLSQPKGIDVDESALNFWAGEVITSIVHMIRQMASPSFSPQAVAWRLPTPSPRESALFQFFGAPMQFGEMETRMSVSADWSRTLIPSADPVVHHHALALMARELETPKEAVVRATVARLVLATLSAPPRLSEVAAELSMSERTLRRRLIALGSTYQSMIDDIHKAHAVRRLQDSNANISTIAAELGYADVRNFRRAFKRWTGLAPASFRKHANSDGA